MKKLAIALCIISAQAFGMESKAEKPIPAFRNLANLQQHLLNALRSGGLNTTERAFAQDMLKDVTGHIREQTALAAAHNFRARVAKEDALIERLARESVECIKKAVAAKKAKKK
jgi:hypothetical protein